MLRAGQSCRIQHAMTILVLAMWLLISGMASKVLGQLNYVSTDRSVSTRASGWCSQASDDDSTTDLGFASLSVSSSANGGDPSMCQGASRSRANLESNLGPDLITATGSISHRGEYGGGASAETSLGASFTLPIRQSYALSGGISGSRFECYWGECEASPGAASIRFASDDSVLHSLHQTSTDSLTFDLTGWLEPGSYTLTASASASSIGFSGDVAGGDSSFAFSFLIRSGDFNTNGILDIEDINLLTAASATGDDPSEFNLNSDVLVNVTDITIWVHDFFGTWFGDANLNKEFNSSDLASVFHAGLYETGDSAVWETGDWNGDGIFDSGDMVTAFVDGGYEAGQRPHPVAVPEPGAWLLLMLATAALRAARGRH
jgi:hypothetical protein